MSFEYMNKILKIYLYTSYQDNVSINKACLTIKDNKPTYLVFNYIYVQYKFWWFKYS